MKCNLCHGQYSDNTTVLSFQRGARTVVVEDVPALVCDVCGDELVTEAVAREVEELLRKEPQGTAPLYRFPERVPPPT
jgi:YgiT-type zinc finger domain-containing protein